METLERTIGSLEQPALGARARFGDPLYCSVMDFLIEEAYLLDHDLLDDWVALLSEDVTYFMPVRQTVLRRAGSGFHHRSGHYYEDYASIQLRVRKLMASRYAYAEDPPSRTRRYVTGVRVHETDVAGEYFVTSSVLVVRNRWDNPTYDLISVERQDVLRAKDDSYRLARRTVLVDQVTLGTPNMTIFI